MSGSKRQQERPEEAECDQAMSTRPLVSCARWLWVVSLVLFCIGRDTGAQSPATPQTAAAAATKDRQQDPYPVLIEEIGEGESEAVLEKLEDLPLVAETHFVRMLALAAKGEGDRRRAIEEMQKAIDAGLPKSRIVSGPRELVAPLAEQAELQAVLESFADRPLQGPMLGSVTDESASFWVRTAQPGEVEILCSTSKDFSRPIVATAQSSSDSDYTAVVKVTGLEFGTKYYYAVRVDGKGEPEFDPHQHFETSPGDYSDAVFSVAFGGNAGFAADWEQICAVMAASKPRCLLLLGDNVNIDAPESTIRQRYCYYRHYARPNFQQLVRGTAVYSLWGDHDFATSKFYGGSLIDHPSWKRSVWSLFRQNWVNPGYGAGSKVPGCWHNFSVGDVDFFMLDGKYYRSNPSDRYASMLGPVQKSLLLDALQKAKGTFKVICSSVPWDFRSAANSRDTWSGYRLEREELFHQLERRKTNGVLLLSANRQGCEAWKISRNDSYDLYEFSASFAPDLKASSDKSGALFSYRKLPSFGLLEFDTSGHEPEVTYKIIDRHGKQVHSLRVKLTDLRHPE